MNSVIDENITYLLSYLEMEKFQRVGAFFSSSSKEWLHSTKSLFETLYKCWSENDSWSCERLKNYKTLAPSRQYFSSSEVSVSYSISDAQSLRISQRHSKNSTLGRIWFFHSRVFITENPNVCEFECSMISFFY